MPAKQENLNNTRMAMIDACYLLRPSRHTDQEAMLHAHKLLLAASEALVAAARLECEVLP